MYFLLFILLVNACLTSSSAISSLDWDVKREYMEAVSLAPALVRNESNLIAFLRTDNFDPTRAARRYALYWKYRKYIFDERWLLPMNQTGTGCLSMSDIEILRSGYVVFHLRSMNDPYQHNACIIDLSRLPRTAGYSGTRCLFYQTAILAEELSRADVVVVYVVTSARRHPMSVDRDIFTFVAQGLPFRMTSFVVVQAHDPVPGRDILIESYAYQQERILEFQSGIAPLRVAADSVQKTLADLRAITNGLERKCIPVALGGTYDYNPFMDWIRCRMSIEDIMSAAPPILNRLSAAATQSPTDAVAAAAAAAVHAPALLMNAREDSKDDNKAAIVPVAQSTAIGKNRPPGGKARLDTYQRRRQSLAELKTQVDNLEGANRAIRADNRRLESALGQARLLAALLPKPPQHN